MSALSGFPGLDGVVVLGAAPHALVCDVGPQVVSFFHHQQEDDAPDDDAQPSSCERALYPQVVSEGNVLEVANI